MAEPRVIEQAIRNVNSESSFIQTLLIDGLGWKIGEEILSVEEISYEWSLDELRADGLGKKIVDGKVSQIGPFLGNPWGIFLIEFRNSEVFETGRGITGILRKILRGLVPSKRKRSDLASFDRENLLFICTYNYQYFSFCYFKAPAEGVKTAPLAAFGWGPDDPIRTVCEFNLPHLEWLYGEASEEKWLEQWAQAFDVEKVTKKFFQAYSEIFKNTEEAITGISNEERRLFTQRIFNRLLFLRFVEKKGWLTFNGKKDYLRALWYDYRVTIEEDSNFYNDRLKLLFFAGLNNPGEVDITGINRGGTLAKVIGDVPYLNGGLFEEEDLDRDTNINVPDSALEPVFTGLLYKFNFTITESTPFDIEVAVDPEMLGKVFEELVTGRHESGSYYTPKNVVSFMCREAIKGYLKTKLPTENEEAIRKFIEEHDSVRLSNPENVLEALKKIKACDPACGSGAYLLGLMQELLFLRDCLFRSHHIDHEHIYKRKLDIIQNSIYGVDKDIFAVGIARLRVWLSLIVDYEGSDRPKLPNLEYKIEAGDSLIVKMSDLQVSDRIIRDYQRKKAEYMIEHGSRKRALKEEVESLRAQIKEWRPKTEYQGFDWQVEFAEVFMDAPAGSDITGGLNLGDRLVPNPEPGGFDIVIANPPYVRQELIDKKVKPELLKQYEGAAEGKSDLYVYFYVRALQILKPGGMHIFICSNSWLDVGFGAKLQNYLLTNAHIKAIYDSAVERQFSTASINTIISLISRGKPYLKSSTSFIYLLDKFEEAIIDPEKRKEKIVTNKEIREAGTDKDTKSGEPVYLGDKWGAKYLRAPDIYWTIMEKGKGKFVRLGDIAEVRRGFTTGCNEFFYLDDEKIKEWGIEEEFLKPVIKSPREVESIYIEPSTLNTKLLVCNLPKSRLHDYNVLNYIIWGENQTTKGRQKQDSGIPWPEISTVAVRNYWYSIKIKNPGDFFCNRFFNDRFFFSYAKGVVEDQTFYAGIFKEKDININNIMAVMNCSVIYLTASLLGRLGLGEGVLQYAVYEMNDLLVLNPSVLSHY